MYRKNQPTNNKTVSFLYVTNPPFGFKLRYNFLNHDKKTLVKLKTDMFVKRYVTHQPILNPSLTPFLFVS